jgi:hypothetical protein
VSESKVSLGDRTDVAAVAAAGGGSGGDGEDTRREECVNTEAALVVEPVTRGRARGTGCERTSPARPPQKYSVLYCTVCTCIYSDNNEKKKDKNEENGFVREN